MRKAPIVILTIVVCLAQLSLIAYHLFVIAPSSITTRLPQFVVATFDISYLNFVCLKHMLDVLRETERSYSSNLDEALELSLRTYQLDTQREERLVRQIGTAIEGELSQAREALAQGDWHDVGAHLETSLGIASTMRGGQCENVVVAAVIGSKTRQCREAGVTLSSQVVLPEELPIQDVEIAAVLFNLIDNALAECVELAIYDVHQGARNIDVYTQTQAGQLFIEVRNPCRKETSVRHEIARRRSSTSLRHGLGTGIVAAIAERHGGIATFDNREGSFVARVMLPLAQSAVEGVAAMQA